MKPITFFLLLCALMPGFAQSGVLDRLSLEFSAGSLSHPLFQVGEMRVRLASQGGDVTLERLEVMGQTWPRLRLSCGRLRLDAGNFQCAQGVLHLPGSDAAFDLRQEGKTWSLRIAPKPQELWDMAFTANGKTRLLVKNGSLEFLAQLLPQWEGLKGWKFSGLLNGSLEYAALKETPRVLGELILSQGGYGSADGRQAAENLGFSLKFSARGKGGRWDADSRMEWAKGAVYSAPLFLKAEGQSLSLAGKLDTANWEVSGAVLDWPGIGKIEAVAKGAWGSGMEEGLLVSEAISLKPLGETVLSPVLKSRAMPRLDLSGLVGLKAAWKAGAPAYLEMVSKDTSLMLENGRMALEGLDGKVAWDSASATQNELKVRRFALGRLESGAFLLPMMVWPKGFALSRPVTVSVLDGELILNHLEGGFVPERKEWEGALGLSLTPVSMEKLTQVLDMPVMGGKLSADLPLVRYANKEAILDGAMIIQVFDGYLQCKDFRLIDPFGVRPRITANVEVWHIDLEQLTRTFSFGQITGFMDARILDLELSAWKPQRFNARIASSEGSFPRRISQKAVDNITAVGGGGTMAAVQASVLRFFKDFGYRRIEISCRLENGVCRMGGIDGLDRNGQFSIIEGGGIPAINIMGYNHNVQWDELIARVKAAVNSQQQPVIQ